MPYHFAYAYNGEIPAGAIPQGKEADGTPLWVARSPGVGENSSIFYKFNSIQPGKVRPAFGGALIPFNGKEELILEYEVLIDAGIWISGTDGGIPDAAIVCGREANGDPLFVARANINGGLQPGKIRFGLGAAYIGFNGVEMRVANWEILVSQEDLRRGI